MKPEDQAQEIELAEWVMRQQQAIQPEPTKASAKFCQNALCGQAIPEARRKAKPGVQLCIECQERKEKLRGRHVAN